MSKSESYALGNVLQELTKGRPFVFVIMAYKSGFPLYERIAAVVQAEVRLACIRADHVSGSGHDLLAKIHLLIERAELIIAEITERSPNVFYEIGYAVAQQKPLLLLIRKGKGVPTDLKGRELIEFRETKEGMELFDHRLREHLSVRVNSRVALLRDMLEAEYPRPAFIVASPRYPSPTQARIKGQIYDHRTFGDNLGVRGLISAFGSMFGETDGVELVSAQYGPPDLLKRDVNLYLIGSQKVNPTSGAMLAALQKQFEPRWSFGPFPQHQPTTGDWRVALYRTDGGKASPLLGAMKKWGKSRELIHSEDYGIIVRGPHPHCRGRMVLIMAGAHSLGTGAACLAATRSVLIRQIKDALPGGVDFADRNRTFWVLVKGKSSEKDRLLDEAGVKVVEAGCWE
jgi:hypothetical protein